jgi:hypothetical protein
MRSSGLPYDPPKTYTKVDAARATKIAQAFDKMEHAPNDPRVKAAYEAMAKETIAQWREIEKTGLQVEWIKPGQADPYAQSPRLAAMDVARNNHWWGFPTDLGFGTGPEAEHAKEDNPLLAPTGIKIDGRETVVNDIFRIVHDYFGHFKEGVGFRADGEDNAWRSHAAMYSELARAAMTSETRGQNSWVNYGPYGEANRKALAGDTHYAPQKIGIMPSWTREIGRLDAKDRDERGRLRDASRPSVISLTASELSGIAAEVSRRATRAVHDGLAARRRPAQIAQDVASQIKAVGHRHSRDMASYMVVKAFNGAVLDELRRQGVRRVGIRAEKHRHPTRVGDAAREQPQKRHKKSGRFVPYSKGPSGYRIRKATREKKALEAFNEVEVQTAGDDLVCPVCEEIAAEGPYGIDEAQSLIPAHPNCRCTFFPVASEARDANPYHEPAGTSKGGQFASGPGGSSAPTWVINPPSSHIPTWQVYKGGAIQGHFTTEGGAQGYVNEATKALAIEKAVKEIEAVAAEAKAAEAYKAALAKPLPAGSALDPRVLDVGGDEWNKKTAERLEREYQAVKPKLEAMMQEAAGKQASEVMKVEPVGSWDDLTGTEKYDTEQQWTKSSFDSEYDHEVSNWQESGQALGDAKSELAHQFEHGPGADHDEWAIDAIAELYKERKGDPGDAFTDPIEPKPDIPYSQEDIIASISIDYENNSGDGSEDPVITFDDSKLQHPNNEVPQQGNLSGIEPSPPSDALTKEMRADITEKLTEALNDKADEMVSDGKIEPPDYLKESAAETLETIWSSMTDEEKFEKAKDYGYAGETSSSAVSNDGEIQWPLPEVEIEKFPRATTQRGDPLNLTEGYAYKATKRAAKFLSIERGAQLLVERGLVSDINEARENAGNIDQTLWKDWVNSSTSNGGRLLQVATADELGGRLRESMDIDPAHIIPNANREFRYIGGFEGVKALVRAKWEATQLLLDAADTPTLKLFRSVSLRDVDKESVVKVTDINHWQKFDKLPDVKVIRNGAASTSVSANVSNNWDGSSGRVVLRAEVPRTAAISIPAYGENTASEQEVVIAGTAWKAWDAYKGTAPDFRSIPIGGGIPNAT